MHPDDIVKMLTDLRERELDKMRPHLANMDSRGQIGMAGNFHNGMVQGLTIAIKMVQTIKPAPPPAS